MEFKNKQDIPEWAIEAQELIKKSGYRSYIVAIKREGPPYSTIIQTDGMDVDDGVMFAIPACCQVLKMQGMPKEDSAVILHGLVDKFINETYGDEKVIDNSGVLN